MHRSCECYGVSKREFDRLLGNRANANSAPIFNYTVVTTNENINMLDLVS